jgi:hypothetical protein
VQASTPHTRIVETRRLDFIVAPQIDLERARLYACRSDGTTMGDGVSSRCWKIISAPWRRTTARRARHVLPQHRKAVRRSFH